MQTLPLANLIPDTVTAVGADDFDQRPLGMSPRRLPAWTRPQVPQVMDLVVRMPSGVRLRFATDTTRIGIHFHATNLVTPPSPRRSIPFDLSIGDKRWAAQSNLGNTITLNSRKVGDFSLERGDADTLWFDDLAPGTKQCELWLPHNAMLELRSLLIDDSASVTPATPDSRPVWIHYGSSISHCMEAERPTDVWPAVAARLAGLNLINRGFGGQCHLDQFVARTLGDSGADLISAKVGINVINGDTMRERVFVPALHGFLDTIRERAPNTPVVLISPIYCPSAEHNPGPTLPGGNGRFATFTDAMHLREGCLTLTRVRKIISTLVEERRAAGDNNLTYVDGLTLFGEADAHDLPDDLHPNPGGYVRMGERFATSVLSGMSLQ